MATPLPKNQIALLALFELRQDLLAATEKGALDLLAEDLPPNLINQFCDGVNRVYTARLTNKNSMTPDDVAVLRDFFKDEFDPSAVWDHCHTMARDGKPLSEIIKYLDTDPLVHIMFKIGSVKGSWRQDLLDNLKQFSEAFDDTDAGDQRFADWLNEKAVSPNVTDLRNVLIERRVLGRLRKGNGNTVTELYHHDGAVAHWLVLPDIEKWMPGKIAELTTR